MQELISTITDDGNKIASEPNQSSVKQNNPNPFAYATEMSYYIEPTVTEALILVYTEQGKLIKKATIKERGQGVYQFNSTDIPSGIYFYSLLARISAPFNIKARQFVNGRKGWQKILSEKTDKNAKWSDG